MVGGVGGSGSGARDAILAAIAKHQSQVQSFQDRAGAAGALAEGTQAGGAQAARGTSFAAEMKEGIASIQQDLSATEALPERMLRGEVQDLHEVAVELKKSDLSFRFALQVRNKLIDAYREVMRMNV